MGAIKIGYAQLSQPEKKLYEQFVKAFSVCSSTVDGSGLSRSVDVMKVFHTALSDNPDIVYVNNTQLRISESLLGGKQIQLTGVCSATQNKAMQRDLQAAVERAIEKIESLNPTSDYHRLLYIYEYLQDNVVYDDDELKACTYGKSINLHAHDAYGALVKGKAVCDGIAAALCLIAQKMGYSATVVHGKATFRTSGFSGHAWNLICIGAKCYHLDATWDINHRCEHGEYSFDYFCVDDDDINTNHDWDINTTPACSSQDLSFYIRNRCYANNLTQLEEIFRRFAASKQSVVRAKISQSIAIPEPASEYLSKKLTEAAGSVGRYGAYKYHFNKEMRCFFARFDDR